MKLWKLMSIAAIPLALAFGNPVIADDHDGDDMDAVEQGEQPDAVTKNLALPEDASETGVENAESGLATANSAGEDGRAFGESKADEVRRNAAQDAEAAGNAVSDEVRTAIAEGRMEDIPQDVIDNLPQEVRDRIPADPPETDGAGGS